MKKITLWLFLLLACSQMNAQLWNITTCGTGGSLTYGPMYSTSAVNANNRTAVIYPASQLTGIVGQNLTTMYFNRTTATGSMAGTPNFKIYLKEVTVTDFGSGAIDWATQVSGATLVYDSNPATAVGTDAGWKMFTLSTNFLYSGQNLAVFYEYINTTASASISWNYEFTTPCANTSNNNTTKYSNNTTGTLATSLGSSNYRRPMIGFDFVVSCNAPNTIISSNLMSTSIDVAWTENAIQPQNGYEYYNSTTNTAPDGTTTPTGTTTTGVTSVSLSSLTPATNYYFWVRGNCGATDKSIWVGPLSYTTPCIAYVAPFSENFDSLPLTSPYTSLPNCWEQQVGPDYWDVTNDVTNSGHTYLPNIGDHTTGTSNYMWIDASGDITANEMVSPNIDLSGLTSPYVGFWFASNNVDNAINHTINLDVWNGTSWINITSLSGNFATWVKVAGVVPSTIPSITKFKIYATANPAGTTADYYFNDLGVDDFFVIETPTCVEPVNLLASNLTSSSAEISWTLTSSALSSNIEYGISGFSQGSGTMINGVTTNPYTLTGLNSNTTYSFYVQSNCGATDGLSIWAGPYIFTTPCAEVTDFNENFDTSPTGSGNLPACWSKLGTSTIVYNQTGSTAPMSPSNRLYMSISTTTTAFAIMPPVSNLQANTHRLKFKVYCTTSNKTMNVGYFTTPGDINTYVQIASFQMQGTTVASTEEFTVIPTGIPVGVKQLVFSIPSGTSTTLYIDDVKWEINSSCVEPTALSATMITNSSATLGWTNGGPETMWDVQYGLAGFNLGTGTMVNGLTSNPHVLTGLIANTSYEFYVRGVCTGPQNSSWSGPYVFKTQCGDVTEFFETFEGYPTGTANPLPDCWGELNTGTGNSYITTGATAPMSPSNRLYMTASGTTPTETCAVLPAVSNLQANTHRLKFKVFSSSGTDRVVAVGYLTDPSDLATFIQLEEVSIPGTASTTTQEITVVPGILPAGVSHLAIKNAGHPTGTTIIYIDDVKWEAIPSCVDPNINLITTNLITNNSANISWVEAGTATQWEIEYGAPGFVLGSGTIVSAPTNPFVLTGLTANTTYDFYVRAVCNTTSSSPWAGPLTFKTQCDDVTEFSENFDTYPTGTANPLGNCWAKGGNGSVYLTTGANSPMSPANRIFMFASSTATPNTVSYAIMPPVSNLHANTHRLKFKGFATAMDRVVQVGYLTDPSDVSTFVQIEEVALASTVIANTQEYTVVPTTIPAGVKHLVLKNPGFASASTTMYIDDVIWETIPACPEPYVPSATNITASTAILNWTEMGAATTWNIEYGPTGYTQGSGTLISGVNTNPYTLIGLTSATTYDYYVQADCGGTNGVSTWTGPFTFTTPCTAFSAPYTQNFDSLALVSPYTALPNCWETQVGPDFWDVTNGTTNLATYLAGFVDHTTGTGNFMWIDASSNITGNEMVTPLIDCSSLTNPYVGFWFGSNNVTNAINHTIALDVWDGSAWLNIAMQTGNFTTWVEVGAAIPSTVPTTTKFRIYAIANPNGTGTDYFQNDLGVDDFFVTEAPVMSVDNFDASNFKAYPNPVNDILNLSYSSEITSVRVINLLGQELISKNVGNTTAQIDMSSLSAGTYIVNIIIDDLVKSIKINKK
ncbi:fibronectin type III domain-containing protein [uncultured Flavobacterium sp.]|uniref:fibronectin type III domain-containing protein n=1 Tax=uncultured Flavobacterium sp. TaxID=165435 RepID=UPI0030C7AFDC